MTRCIEYGDEITSTSTEIKPSAMELIGKGRCDELYDQAFEQHNEDFEEKIGQILQTTNFIYENSKSIISLEYWLYPAIGVITFAYLSEYLAPILTIIICGGSLFRFFHIQGLQATYSTGLTSSFTSLHSSPKKDVRLLGIVLCIECYLWRELRDYLDWDRAEDLSKKNGYDPDELKHAKDLDNYYNA